MEQGQVTTCVCGRVGQIVEVTGMYCEIDLADDRVRPAGHAQLTLVCPNLHRWTTSIDDDM